MSRLLIHQTFKIDFEDLFSSLSDEKKPLVSLTKFNDFISNWNGYFKENGLIADCFLLSKGVIFSRVIFSSLAILTYKLGKGDIETVNDNKLNILRLYGVAFHLYMKSCRFLDKQMKPDYIDILMVKFEVVID